ncbi:MAG: TraB/GumN family protein [Caulobacteraceae bacterium]|nr:TraB/GumN family protein [Caulobacteraceae bacterium]
MGRSWDSPTLAAARPSLPNWGGKFIIFLFALLLALPATAAPLGRPMWWKVSNGGGSTLWILGMPDGAPVSFSFNQDALRHRIDLADAAIMPQLQDRPILYFCAGDPAAIRIPRSRPDAVRTFPGGDINECVPVAWPLNMVMNAQADIAWSDPLSSRLPRDLLARVERDIPTLLGSAGTQARHARTMDLALWLDLWNWPHGDERLGNPINRAALDLAQNRKLKTEIVPQPRLWMPVYTTVYQGEAPPREVNPDPILVPRSREWFPLYAPFHQDEVVPPEALQQKCLSQVLDQTESGQMAARRMAGLQAWAAGDLDHALRRTGTVHYCLMGEEASASAQDYLKSAAYRYYSRTDKAFDKPGQTVAVIELDPLLLEDGGVLDHYRRLGFQITTSDGLE